MSITPTLCVTLHSTIGNSEGTDPADTIVKQISRVNKSVQNIREYHTNLERNRDQYVIHLQQCQEDHNILRNIYKTLKQKTDLQMSFQAENAFQIQEPAEEEKPVQAASSLRSLPTLEQIQIKPIIIPLQETLNQDLVKLSFTLNTQIQTRAVQFSNNGQFIAFSDSNYIIIVQSSTGELASSIEIEQGYGSNKIRPVALRYSLDDQFIAISGPNNDLLLYSIETKTLVHKFEGHTMPVSAITFSSDGKWIISGGMDGTIIVWSMSTYEQVKRIIQPQMPDSTIVALSSTNDLHAIGFRGGMIGIYNEQFEDPMMSFPAHQAQLTNLAVAEDGTIASVAHDKIVKIWTLRGIASSRFSMEGHNDVVTSCVFSPKEQLLFTGSTDCELRAWNYKKGKALFKIDAHKNTIYQISHHPTERMIASCSGDGVICVWKYEEIKIQ